MATPSNSSPPDSGLDELDLSSLVDLTQTHQEPTNLSCIPEERNGDGRIEIEKKEENGMGIERDPGSNEGGKSQRHDLSKPRHSSAGHNYAMERTTLRKASSIFTSFEDSSMVDGFVQLNVLKVKTSGVDVSAPLEKEWKEIARWIKYEQDLEEGANRLGRPHIAALGFHFIMRLDFLLEKNAIALFDVEEKDMAGIGTRITEILLSSGKIQQDEFGSLMEDLVLTQEPATERDDGGFTSRRHKNVGWEESRAVEPGSPESADLRSSKPKNIILRKMAFANRSLSFSFHQRRISDSDVANDDIEAVEGKNQKDSFDSFNRRRRSSMRIVGHVSKESAIILVRGGHKKKVGELVFVRLADAILLPDVSIIPVPTRIIVLILAPNEMEEEYMEMGRSVGTLLSNRAFYETALGASSTKDLQLGINEFLHESIVLPPGEWYAQERFHELLPQHELENKTRLIRKHKYKGGSSHVTDSTQDLVTSKQLTFEHKELHDDDKPTDPFVRTGRPFGGLVNDMRRRYPFYKDDFLAGLRLQCVAATIFLYFAAIAHNVTLGGLLAQKTNGWIGVPETLVAATSSGTLFAFVSAQPLLPIATTAPLLLFDEILYVFLDEHGFEFLPARAWIGLWVFIISLIYVGFEASVVVKNFTRFTQETFSALISVVFVVESISSLLKVYKEHPLLSEYNDTGNPCTFPIEVDEEHFEVIDSMVTTTNEPLKVIHRTNEPNTALLSTILMFGTFLIGFTLKKIKTSQLFGEGIRNALSDFSIPIAISIMVGLDVCAGDVFTGKIQVPSGFQTTRPEKRGWLIPMWGMEKPFNPWVPLVTILPGTLVFILMSMTLQICELILSERHPLNKGSGFHLDVLILGFINFGAGLFGLPWLSCATLLTLAHCAALTVYSSNNPPGIPPVIIQIIQQRLTALGMSVMIGLSILAAGLLQYVSMSILFGVFFYMGVTSLIATQFYERMLLFFTPPQDHPPVVYVRRVPTWKIHLYTLIQITCIAILWIVKSIKGVALIFPFIIALLVPIRKSFRHVFTENELEALDGKAKASVAEKPLEKTS